MNGRFVSQLRRGFLLPLLMAMLTATAVAQVAPSGQPETAPPVSYASVSQLNTMLTQLEQASQATQLDIAKLRIERWKADGGSKRQAQSNAESIQRNLQDALPRMIAALRTSPENLPSTFKLYRNLDALYDVFGSVVESAGAFGSKDEFQSLDNDLNVLEKSRHAFADRMETLAGAKEEELGRLRAEIRTAQAAAAAQPPKKVIVDDTEPVKKTVKKKPAAKTSGQTAKSTTPSKTTPQNAAAPNTTPPAKSQ